jgi:hypothetical protein
MSGITPPSIVTYSYEVDRQFNNYVNVSFPFRVKIEQVWFTGDRLLIAEVDSNYQNAARGLKLAAIKSANPRNPDASWNAPSDWANFFGTSDGDSGDIWAADEDLKPTMWMGNPDDRPAGTTIQWAGTPWWGNGFRSSAKSAPAKDSDNNPNWYNNLTDGPNNRGYKTDLSIMNPDEILSMFVYDYTGDWDYYADYEKYAVVNIHIAYTGVADVADGAAATRLWGPWYDY